ncbi:MAG: DUF4381 domain-containing protein [Marinobacter sp.]|uniref:DUF4381 domain-containing protein n=1 Tax=Marinobacter sp. TaxID=50741 RepID=UPI00299D7EF3|nr:DUF4381 domain-containing protein [Marinobacter sp.]MDX1755221.1 DUF4381 domain-containing protein [Marinobacter sp.]
MSLAAELANLRELPPPELPGLWPQAWGWWLLLAVTGLALAALITRRLSAYHHDRYRREALAELAQLERAWRQQPEARPALRKLPGLLKRVILYLHARSGAVKPPPPWRPVYDNWPASPLPRTWALAFPNWPMRRTTVYQS